MSFEALKYYGGGVDRTMGSEDSRRLLCADLDITLLPELPTPTPTGSSVMCCLFDGVPAVEQYLGSFSAPRVWPAIATVSIRWSHVENATFPLQKPISSHFLVVSSNNTAIISCNLCKHKRQPLLTPLLRASFPFCLPTVFNFHLHIITLTMGVASSSGCSSRLRLGKELHTRLPPPPAPPSPTCTISSLRKCTEGCSR